MTEREVALMRHAPSVVIRINQTKTTAKCMLVIPFTTIKTMHQARTWSETKTILIRPSSNDIHHKVNKMEEEIRPVIITVHEITILSIKQSQDIMTPNNTTKSRNHEHK